MSIFGGVLLGGLPNQKRGTHKKDPLFLASHQVTGHPSVDVVLNSSSGLLRETLGKQCQKSGKSLEMAF